MRGTRRGLIERAKSTMKKLFTIITCAVLLCAITILPGCAGTPKTVAYKTLKATSDAVDGAMKAYAEAVVKGAISEDTAFQVRKLHGEYRIAFAQALNAARFDYEMATPGAVAGLAAELTGLIASYVR
jgi:uncharacterized protein YgbK (DUF1537 family)